jgi:NADH-quinone oxidoreductase subunit J
MSLMLGFLGLAGLYLKLGAQFVGFVQILVYLGAIGVLFAFVVMMTRSRNERSDFHLKRTRFFTYTSVAVLGTAMLWGIYGSRYLFAKASCSFQLDVNELGIGLLRNTVLPLEIGALLLTASLIGAVCIAISELGGPDGKSE